MGNHRRHDLLGFSTASSTAKLPTSHTVKFPIPILVPQIRNRTPTTLFPLPRKLWTPTIPPFKHFGQGSATIRIAYSRGPNSTATVVLLTTSTFDFLPFFLPFFPSLTERIWTSIYRRPSLLPDILLCESNTLTNLISTCITYLLAPQPTAATCP
jgi:hypothetical protein